MSINQVGMSLDAGQIKQGAVNVKPQGEETPSMEQKDNVTLTGRAGEEKPQVIEKPVVEEQKKSGLGKKLTKIAVSTVTGAIGGAAMMALALNPTALAIAGAVVGGVVMAGVGALAGGLFGGLAGGKAGKYAMIGAATLGVPTAAAAYFLGKLDMSILTSMAASMGGGPLGGAIAGAVMGGASAVLFK
jgi:hypothetical protein